MPLVIDYLSLDVEGAEDLVMSTFPWSEHRVSIFSIENPSRALQNMLRQQQYQRFCSVRADQIWVHATVKVPPGTNHTLCRRHCWLQDRWYRNEGYRGGSPC